VEKKKDGINGRRKGKIAAILSTNGENDIERLTSDGGIVSVGVSFSFFLVLRGIEHVALSL